jgi:hypothetical protein
MGVGVLVVSGGRLHDLREDPSIAAGREWLIGIELERKYAPK